jgi:hypothetical protein
MKWRNKASWRLCVAANIEAGAAAENGEKRISNVNESLNTKI